MLQKGANPKYIAQKNSLTKVQYYTTKMFFNADFLSRLVKVKGLWLNTIIGVKGTPSCRYLWSN